VCVWGGGGSYEESGGSSTLQQLLCRLLVGTVGAWYTGAAVTVNLLNAISVHVVHI
jgi:hypothetical protein